jgi:uncharacterized FlaG/YvyC family protein
MSIGPVQNLGPESQSAKASPAAERSQTIVNQLEAVGKVAQPGTGSLPKQEAPGTKDVSSPLEVPQDEVQLQRDPQIRDEVVIKYLDKATRDLILQIPSAEVLSVDRGIYQEFQAQAKVRESAGAAVDKGEEPHGH